MSLPPLVLLDRDGVLNRDRPNYVATPEQWVWEPGARKALARLREAQVPVAVLTNQAGVGKGWISGPTLDAIHARMRAEARAAGGRIDAVFVCPHTEAQDCLCRKPRPGLLKQAAARFGCRLGDVPFVGDTRRDLEAAIAIGAQPVLVRTGKGRTAEKAELPAEVTVYEDLQAFVEALLARAGELRC